ncbi:MAG: ATP-binding cassette domain-containing protein [Nitrospinaceae bacterium]|jgi:iron complex transport system ATP-binding protein|nr:MAG: ATP-binding cassette domain-containing protein [Nitrospinaceae bacterium]
MAASLIDIKNADVYVGGRRVLQNIHWRMRDDENWAVVGNNGAGKTTFMKLIFGEAIPVHGGEVRLFGSPRLTPLEEIRKHIGFVSAEFQADYDNNCHGWEVVASGLFSSIGLHQTVSQPARERALYEMESLGILPLANKHYRALSYGEARRVLLARALVSRPRLLILDEPCTGLDIPTREHFLAMLETLSRKRVRLIYVTHHIEEILPTVGHVLYLKNGRIFSQGEKEAMLTGPTLSQALGCELRLREDGGRYWVSGAGKRRKKPSPKAGRPAITALPTSKKVR